MYCIVWHAAAVGSGVVGGPVVRPHCYELGVAAGRLASCVVQAAVVAGVQLLYFSPLPPSFLHSPLPFREAGGGSLASLVAEAVRL